MSQPITLRQDPSPVNIVTTKGFTRIIPVVWNFSIVGYTFQASIVLAGTGTVVPLPVILNTSTNHTDLDINTATDTAVPVGTHTWYLQWTDAAGNIRPLMSGAFSSMAIPA